MKDKFPKWIFKTKDSLTVAFRNLKCVDGFEVAVRVGPDGLIVFGKNGLPPNLFYMTEEEFASLSDFIGKKGEGIRPFEAGCVRSDGSIWFSDCIYEPGLIEEDFEELKSLLRAFHKEFVTPPSDKQKKRIEKMKELRGEAFVKEYFLSKFPLGDFQQMTRNQAQKVITGLQWIEPKKPITNVYVNPEWIS